MQVIDAIKDRRSIREYRHEKVSYDNIRMLINAARWAPSAGNLQPWDFIIVRKNLQKKQLAEASHNQQFIAEAPVAIVACTNPTRSSSRYGLRGSSLYCILDTAFAIQNILLTAYSLGLGTCIVGAFDEDQVKKTLRLPDDIIPLAIIPVGYSAEKPKIPSRRHLDEIVHYEKF